MQRSTGKTPFLSTEPSLALGFVLVAMLARSPALLYSALNYDESMYLLMGSELAKGHLPYTTICDIKPFGLFALATPVAASPLDPVFTARIVSSIAVGLTAWMLRQVARRLFRPDSWAIGTAAGICYIVFSLADGGTAFQGELFQNTASVLGLLVILRAVDQRGRPSLATMSAAGLVLGAGIQIKQSVVFDLLAFLAGFFILTVPTWKEVGAWLRVSLKPLLILGASSLVPTILVIALYATAGKLDAWTAANINAHRVFYGREWPFLLDPAFRAMWEQLPLWLGAATALLLVRSLTQNGSEQRAVGFLGVWWVAVIGSLVFLRISADHYFLQFLPPLSLLTGLAVGRGLLALIPERRTAGLALAVLGGLTLFAVAKNPLIHSIYILKDRLTGENWAGDTPRRAAADLKSVLRDGDAVYVVGYQPAIYVLTGAVIPTRFAFTGLPHFHIPERDGCPWVEPAVEMGRVMESRPRFVVVEQDFFLREAMRPDVRKILDEHLRQDYRLWRSFEEHPIHRLYPFERFVMNGGAPVKIYELNGR
jgi:hypothetical protein